jgi:hypothetical protein
LTQFQRSDPIWKGVDLPDIELIIQWKATCDLCMLWQRFGRCACKLSLTGRALFLVELKFFDAKRELRVVAAQARKRKGAEKAAGDGQTVKHAQTTKGVCTTVTQDVDAGNVSKDDAITRADGNVDTPSVLPEPVSANPTNSPENIQAVAAAKHLYETEQ